MEGRWRRSKMGFRFRNILFLNTLDILSPCEKMGDHTIYETAIKRERRSNECFLRKVNSLKLREDVKNLT